MSKKSPAKKPGFNEGNEILYDPYPNYVATEYFQLELPWPEWNDSEINTEKWDEGKSKPATKSTGKTESVHSIHFEDPNPPILQDVAEWKRPHSFFSSEQKITLYEVDSTDLDLSIPSKVTAKKKLFKRFVELLPVLQCYALKEKFPVEYESPTYFPNTQGETWRPWHHIYALCKAGKGQTHKPLYCPYGKYVVRLFYMGVWRKLVVDDKIPCDEDGRCMLPVSNAELWPIILMKALLKIPNAEEISFLSFFTGWVCCRTPVIMKGRDEIWEYVTEVLPKWMSDDEKMGLRPVFVAAELRKILEDENHEIGLTMSRDKPLSNASQKDATPAWKRLRWVYWASKKGIWTDELLIPPYRCLLLITNLEAILEELFIDPELENRLFGIEPEPEDGASKQGISDPEQWVDFTKVAKFLSNLFLFYKPSSFPFKLKATYIRKPDKGGKGPSDLYFLSPSITMTKNEPTYLYCESLEDVFILISLTVCPKEFTQCSYPEVIKIHHGSLVVEEFDWQTLKEQKILGVIKTSGNDVLQLKLGPGRHVMKLWLDSNSLFVVQFFSNIEVTFFKGSKVRFFMSRESERISEYINEISVSFTNLISKFGKPEWVDGLFEFYKSSKIGDVDGFVDVFSNSLVEVLKGMIATDEWNLIINALRSLFVSLRIGEVRKYGDETVQVSEEESEKATTIQRHFRGYRVRLLFKRQNPNRKEFKLYCDKLKKLTDLILTPAKREVEVGRLIREINRTNPEINFSFKNDIVKVIELDEFTGKTSTLEPGAWSLFTRFTFFCHSDDQIPCAFFFSCNLKHCTVMVIDNDTQSEIFKLTSNVGPNYYTRNRNGFTLIAFGWNDNDSKVANWRLEMVRLKHFPTVHPCNILTGSPCSPYQPPNLQTYELKNVYVPNRRNVICRCLIKIKKRTMITVRFFVSHENVHVDAKITLGLKKSFSNLDLGFEEHEFEESVITENETTNSAIVFPSVILEHYDQLGINDEDVSGIYTFEAVVRYGTWPLTPQEWGTVEPVRTGCEPSYNNSPMPLGSRRRSTRMSRRSLKMFDNPYWCLQVFTEDNITVEEDLTRPLALKAMKENWEENEPGRRANGMKIREEFLKGIFPGEEGEFENLLHQMKSFSYLSKDPSSERTLISPRVLPKTPIEDLISQFGYQISQSKLTRVGTIESEIEELYYYTKEYQGTMEKLDQDRLFALEKSKNRRLILETHLSEERKLSNELMEEAYEARMKIIQRLLKNKLFNR